jgi:hypothetical protein
MTVKQLGDHEMLFTWASNEFVYKHVGGNFDEESRLSAARDTGPVGARTERGGTLGEPQK